MIPQDINHQMPSHNASLSKMFHKQIIMSRRSINFYLVINIVNIVDVIIKCTHNSGSTFFDLATLVIIIISAHHGVSEEGVFTDVYLRMFPNPVIVAIPLIKHVIILVMTLTGR